MPTPHPPRPCALHCPVPSAALSLRPFMALTFHGLDPWLWAVLEPRCRALMQVQCSSSNSGGWRPVVNAVSQWDVRLGFYRNILCVLTFFSLHL